MEYILTERQFELISKKLIYEQNVIAVTEKLGGKSAEKVLEKLGLGTAAVVGKGEQLANRLEKTIEQNTDIAAKVEKINSYVEKGLEKEFEQEFESLMKIPTFVNAIGEAISIQFPDEIARLSSELIQKLPANVQELVNLAFEKGGSEEVEKALKANGMWKDSESFIWKGYKPSVKTKFDLTKRTFKTPKKPRDYGIVKISDNLEMVTKPRFKDYVAEIRNVKNPQQYMDLKKGTDQFGEYYYLSTKMENPIDAGRAMTELIKLIPKGARFGERATGSLSTDSFYNMLRRIKSFEPKVIGRIRLNKSGVKRFQEYVRNPVESNEYPPILRFYNSKDAEPLVNALNNEIKKTGLNSFARVSKNSDGLFEILIPNIEFKVR